VPSLQWNSSLTVLVINFLYGADIRMIQCRSRLGLALKAGRVLVGLWLRHRAGT
jgi:hypothetical protein